MTITGDKKEKKNKNVHYFQTNILFTLYFDQIIFLRIRVQGVNLLDLK